MTGGVLTLFLMSDLDETFTEASDGYSLQSDAISRVIRNVQFLLAPGRDLEDRLRLKLS